MKTSHFDHFVLNCVIAALLAGCAGSQPPISAPGAMPQSRVITEHAERGGSWMVRSSKKSAPTYQVSKPLLFVLNTDQLYDLVTIYNPKLENPNPIAAINDGLFDPGGDCIDHDGTLYVTNEPASSPGWVSEYPLGQTSPTRTITDGINSPAFCAIDSSGNLWVTNLALDDIASTPRVLLNPIRF